MNSLISWGSIPIRHRRMLHKALLLLSALALLGCVALAAGELVWPEASGEKVRVENALTLDISHMEDGYVMACGAPASSRYKLRVKKDDTTLDYDLNIDGDYEVIPLQLGSGRYSFSLYRQASGNKYGAVGAAEINVELSREDAAFLCPNQYVNYTPDSPAVQKAAELCGELKTDQEKMQAVRDFLKENYMYDFIKALMVSSQKGTLPDIDGCFESKKGICQDYSALVACMLRSQGIPTQIAIGHAGQTAHAWNYVMIDGTYQFLDMTVELKALGPNETYTLERVY